MAAEWSARRRAALLLAFVAASVVIYWPALPGAFISDDIHYVALNPYVQSLSLANLRAILDPFGDVAWMTANWAPVHLFAHMLEWRLFGVNVAAYHLTNAVLHAGVSFLLVALLAASRVPWAAAALAGGFFLVHPANVEAVAWISQLKTLLAMAFMLAALLLRERHPLLATLAFVLGFFSKALAGVALPMAWALERAAPATGAGARGARRTLWIWTALFVAFAIAEFAAFFYAHPGGSAFFHRGATDTPTLASRVGFSAAIGMRYLAMAATGFGVSAFHELAPSGSLLEPWTLAGLAAGCVFAARLLHGLRKRSREAAWWLLAAVSFAPVAQVFRFLYPMADRYLYFILPGLLGGALLFGGELLARRSPGVRRAAATALAVGAAAACVPLAFVSHARAALWVSDARVMADAIRHYPGGSMAHYVRARGAARERDAAAAAAAIRVAARNPAFGFQHVRTDPKLDPVRRSPAFQAVMRELASDLIKQSQASATRMTEADLVSLAQAQLTVEDAAGALATLDRALALRGGFQATAAALARDARALAQAQQAAAAAAREDDSASPAPPAPGGAP